MPKLAKNLLSDSIQTSKSAMLKQKLSQLGIERDAQLNKTKKNSLRHDLYNFGANTEVELVFEFFAIFVKYLLLPDYLIDTFVYTNN